MPTHTEPDVIHIRGAREHNLRGVDMDIPQRRLVVFTGVSGSGKSSMAFDTLFAEGQRRYLESLSSYARQFLGQMEKPHYDNIRGLTPTIAVAQKSAGRNPRSTVGTLTEIYDYLRVLFARAGQQRCHRCGQVVKRQSAAEIVERLQALGVGRRVVLLAPIVHQQVGPHQDTVQEVARAGFTRLRVDGTLHRLEDLPPLSEGDPHDIQVVVDRLKIRPDSRERLTDSVETTLAAGQGVLMAIMENGDELLLSEHLVCHDCGITFPELTPASFSFNSPQGMCPHCSGLGYTNEVDPSLMVPDPQASLHQGAVALWKNMLERQEGWNYQVISQVAQHFGFSLDTPWSELPTAARQVLLHGASQEMVFHYQSKRGEGRWNIEFEGAIPTVIRRLRETKSEHARRTYLSYMSSAPCSHCGGSRLRPESAAVRVGPHTIVQLSSASVEAALRTMEALMLPGSRGAIAAELVKEIASRLRFLVDVGLGYLSLDRGGATLSGGESQRIRLASQLGGELTGVTYVLDEPSIGLHQRDNRRLITTMQRLRDLGNTVVVVEHDRETMEAADMLFDFGPGAGREGGTLVYSGPPTGILQCQASITGAYLCGRREIPLPHRRRAPGEPRLTVSAPRENNLQGMDIHIPLGVMVAITGVSGAGKSSLVSGILSPALHNALHGARRQVGLCAGVHGVEHLSRIIDVDQAPIGRSPRSCPATYTRLMNRLRQLFAQLPEAQVRGMDAGWFSYNAKGQCPACAGRGALRIEMHFLSDVWVTCEDCGGRRYRPRVDEVTWKGQSIADVLEMTVEEASVFLHHHRGARSDLGALLDVGLGYLRLGQPATTLSGGEAQRVKLARELTGRQGHTVYLLDEPTTGLHPADIERLLQVLHRLVDNGHTVVVIEHQTDVVRAADHVIDLGPEGGLEGGKVVATGTPAEIAAHPRSFTGEAIRAATRANMEVHAPC